MTNDLCIEVNARLSEEDAIPLPRHESFLSEDGYQQLEQLADSLPREHVSIGYAGEPNYLEVGRFLTDVESAKVVSGSASEEAVAIVSSAHVTRFYKQVLELDKIQCHRIQYNILGEGCFVGYHLDTDSNPDYLKAGVI